MLIVIEGDNLSRRSAIINSEKMKYAYIVNDKVRCAFDGGGWIDLSLKDGEALFKQIKEENDLKIRETEARIKYFSERQPKDIQI